MEEKYTIRLHKYDNTKYDSTKGEFSLVDKPEFGNIFLVDDDTEHFWELSRILSDDVIEIARLVETKHNFVFYFDIWKINPKKHKFWVLLAPIGELL